MLKRHRIPTSNSDENIDSAGADVGASPVTPPRGECNASDCCNSSRNSAHEVDCSGGGTAGCAAGDVAQERTTSLQRSDAPASESTPEDIANVVERIGFGPFQIRVMLVIGVIFASEAIEIFLLTFIRKVLLEDLPGATEPLLTLATSLVFVGMLVGSMVFGTMADRSGRRFALYLVLLIPTIGGIGSCLALNIWMFLFCRFVVGFGVGGGHIAPSLLMELLPAKDREKYVVISYAWWTVGALYTCGCAWALRGFSWRLFALVAVLPYVICLSCLGLVPESPRYHCVRGRSDLALATLQRMARRNKRPVPHRPLVAHLTPKHSKVEMLRLLFAPSLRSVTVLLWIIWCAANSSYYGMIMLSTQQILGGEEESFGAAALEALGELPAYILLYEVTHRYGRKWPLFVSPLIAAVFLVAMRLCYTSDKSFSNLLFVGEVVSAFICRCAALFLFDLVYLYTPEVYPTAVRGTGNGACSAVARLTGIATPFVAYTLLQANKQAPYFFFTFLLVCSALAAKLLRVETCGRALEDEVEEEHQRSDIDDRLSCSSRRISCEDMFALPNASIAASCEKPSDGS